MNRIETYQMKDEPIPLRDAIFPGVLSGLAGAVLMASVLILFGHQQGDLWRPLKLIGGVFFQAGGESGFQVAPVAAGVAIHLSTAVLLGIFFTWIGGYLSIGPAIGWGGMFGLAVWVIMQFGILPVVNPILALAPPIPLALSHLIFGFTLGCYPYFLPKEKKAVVPQVRRKAA